MKNMVKNDIVTNWTKYFGVFYKQTCLLYELNAFAVSMNECALNSKINQMDMLAFHDFTFIMWISMTVFQNVQPK